MRRSRSTIGPEIAPELDQRVRVGTASVGVERDDRLRRRSGRPAGQPGTIGEDGAVDLACSCAGNLERHVRAETPSEQGDRSVRIPAGEMIQCMVDVGHQQFG